MKRGKKISLSYFIEQVRGGWSDWRWWYFQFTNQVLMLYFSFKKNKGDYVLNEGWDNLILLDACRFDLFQEKIEGTGLVGFLEKRVSRGSSTADFLLENFEGRNLDDIIYITSNPYVQTMLNNPFYKTVNLWLDEWDNNLGTVHPKQVAKAAIEAHMKHPDKRLIVHFMQPHCPFIGEYTKEGNFWQIALGEGREEVMKAYGSNLDFVLPYVKKLLGKLRGKSIVSSDHGNACGEKVLFFPVYGHPKRMRIPALVDVPWFIVTGVENELH